MIKKKIFKFVSYMALIIILPFAFIMSLLDDEDDEDD